MRTIFEISPWFGRNLCLTRKIVEKSYIGGNKKLIKETFGSAIPHPMSIISIVPN
jgi:hypothetical protein